MLLIFSKKSRHITRHRWQTAPQKKRFSKKEKITFSHVNTRVRIHDFIRQNLECFNTSGVCLQCDQHRLGEISACRWWYWLLLHVFADGFFHHLLLPTYTHFFLFCSYPPHLLCIPSDTGSGFSFSTCALVLIRRDFSCSDDVSSNVRHTSRGGCGPQPVISSVNCFWKTTVRRSWPPPQICTAALHEGVIGLSSNNCLNQSCIHVHVDVFVCPVQTEFRNLGVLCRYVMLR